MSRPASVPAGLAAAARTVIGAPGLLVGVAVAQWLAAKLASTPIVAAVAAATEGHAPGTRPEAHERILAVATEVFVAQPAIAAVMVVCLVSVALLSALGWTVLAGGVIVRYGAATRRARPDARTLGGQWLATLPAVVAQSLWHWGLRALAIVAMTTATASLPTALQWAVIGVTMLVATVALDVARVGVVTGLASPFHPRTAARSFLVALRTPRLLLPAAGLAALGAVATAFTVLCALWALAEPTWVWAARATSIVTLTLGLVRLAFVTHHPAVVGLASPTGGDPGNASLGQDVSEPGRDAPARGPDSGGRVAEAAPAAILAEPGYPPTPTPPATSSP